nr:50S ribosomal protein L24P [uncultured archaeon]
MKQEFSTSWVSSVQPRKQRKYGYNAPLHIKHRFLSSNLSKELRKKYGKRNLPLRKGDEVLVMRGTFKKKKAKVSKVDLKNTRIALDGIQRTKKEGTKVNVYFHPSVLQIYSLVEDKFRLPQQKKEIKKEKTEEKTQGKSE